MSQQDRARWNERYAREGLVMGAGPKPVIRELGHLLPQSGRALDIACGEGQLALWLAGRGLQVTAVDIAAVGLEKLRRQAKALELEDRVVAVETDLDDGLPDLQAGLDLVTCIDFYSPPLMAAARELLAPAGLLLVQVVLQPPGGDSPRRAARNEALGFAAGLGIHFYREGIINGRELAQLLAQRPPVGTLRFSD
jgi:SAM-dependent methyltransferase